VPGEIRRVTGRSVEHVLYVPDDGSGRERASGIGWGLCRTYHRVVAVTTSEKRVSCAPNAAATERFPENNNRFVLSVRLGARPLRPAGDEYRRRAIKSVSSIDHARRYRGAEGIVRVEDQLFTKRSVVSRRTDGRTESGAIIKRRENA